MASKKDQVQVDYGSLEARLEEIISQMDSGELSLNKLQELYKEAEQIIVKMEEMLRSAED
jgi:exodeoxyribonuclease VII small subunit